MTIQTSPGPPFPASGPVKGLWHVSEMTWYCRKSSQTQVTNVPLPCYLLQAGHINLGFLVC